MLTPHIYQVEEICHETADVFTLTLAKKNSREPLSFLPGQFNMLYHFGYGEVAISISNDPYQSYPLRHTIRAVGSVTKRMQELKPGEEIGVRGPYGSHWPLIKKNCDILVIAGGIGLAPLTPLLFECARQRDKYQKVTLLYGSRSPEDIIFDAHLNNWREQGIDIELTVDRADVDWKGRVGVVTKMIKERIKDPNNTLVFICGPEIMIKFAIHELLGAQVDKNHIFASLERNMQCAVGFCGRCQYGPYFLCKDGPVFSYKQLEHWLMIREL